jgi:hypothetical protein
LFQRSSAIIISILAGIGIASLISSVLLTSTVLAFMGLGLTFWAGILLYIRPNRYVRSDLIDSAALPPLEAIDRVMTALGCTEKGVYIPTGNPDKTVVFVPSRPLTSLPRAETIAKETLAKDPNGLIILPPGYALANLIEDQLGVEFKQLPLEKLSGRLSKLLIEDLEVVQDFDMQVDRDIVRFKLVESIYSELCSQLRATTRLSFSLGCPICSAMACIVAQSYGKPVALEESMSSEDGRTILSSCRILGA